MWSRSRGVFPGAERATDYLQAHPARGLDEHHVARSQQFWHDGGGLGGVGEGMGLAVEALRDRCSAWTHGHEDVDSGRGRLLAELGMELPLPGSEFQHVAEYSDAARAVGG